VPEEEARRAGEIAERVADHEVRAVVVAGVAEVARPVDAAHLAGKPEGSHMAHVRRPLARVEDEEAVFLAKMLDLVRRPGVEVLRERDAGQAYRLRLFPQPLRRDVAVHRPDDRVDVHIDDGAHMQATIP